MSDSRRLAARLWFFVPLGALALLTLADLQRARRVEAVTQTDAESATIDASSPTGYAGGKRWLIVPEQNTRSYQWIAETQQLLARGGWRVRHTAADNAPFGRVVHAASPYRWWLAALAQCDRALSGRPLGVSVERAALWSEPVLHLLLVLATTWFVSRYFGQVAATLAAVGLVALYPFAGSFLPGVPDDRSLARICALWSVLPLLAALSRRRDGPTAPTRDAARTERLFALAGVAGGMGLWVDAGVQTPVLGGIALGGALATWIGSRAAAGTPKVTAEILPWRSWALAGAATSLLAYLAEYFPGHLDFRLEVNHPLYGVAWLALGELLRLIDVRLKNAPRATGVRLCLSLALALLGIASLPIAMQLGGGSPFFAELADSRLTSLPDGPVAQNFAAWLTRDSLNGAVLATCLSLVFPGFALWQCLRPQSDASVRAAFALALGPLGLALVFACCRLAWWNVFGALLLALLVAAAAGLGGRARRSWIGLAGVLFIAGAIQLVPPAVQTGKIEFTKLEVEALVERELAHWLADRAEPNGAIVLAPPSRTASLCFHGGFRGLGTANWENRDGLEATVQLATATTADQARALIDERGVTHLVLPSWDSDLQAFARWRHANPNDAFVMALQHWALPPWLRPLPYRVPEVAGFENQTVSIFAVTDESNRAAGVSRLAEYFVETAQLELAAASREALRRYPTDLGALVALARVEKARGDTAAFTQALDAVLASVSSGFDRTLAWDRRVSLAVVLTLGGKTDIAREQIQRCLAQATDARIRALTTGALYQLLVLTKSHGLAIADPASRELAFRLLPAEVRARL